MANDVTAIQCIPARGHEMTSFFLFFFTKNVNVKKKCHCEMWDILTKKTFLEFSLGMFEFKWATFQLGLRSVSSEIVVLRLADLLLGSRSSEKKKKRKNFWRELFKMESQSASHFFSAKISLPWGFDLGFGVFRKHSRSVCLNMYTYIQIFWKNKVILLYSSDSIVSKITLWPFFLTSRRLNSY